VPFWMQENSVPDRSAPRRTRGLPEPSTRWLPTTDTDRGAAATGDGELAITAPRPTTNASR